MKLEIRLGEQVWQIYYLDGELICQGNYTQNPVWSLQDLGYC